MSDVNPYQPPSCEPGAPSYWSRARRALRRAYAKYQTELLRQNVSTAEHWRAWILLLVVVSLLVTWGTFLIAALWAGW